MITFSTSGKAQADVQQKRELPFHRRHDRPRGIVYSEQPGIDGRARVLYMVDTLNVGGTETQLVETALRLHARGHYVTVGCLRAEGPLLGILQKAGIRIVEFRKEKTLLSLTGAYQLIRLAALLRRQRFDVLHAHDLWANLLGVPAARLARTPVVISSRRYLADLDWYSPLRDRMMRLLYRLSTHVLVNSASIRELLVQRYGLPAEKIGVIHNAVDADRFACPRAREKHLPATNKSSKVIAVLANLYRVKGHVHLIAAARTVCSVFPEAIFLLIGDGPERRGLEQQVRKAGLENNFLFLGQRRDVPELMACCDLGVLPSEAEAMPNSILEMMAAGLPVVATLVGGIPEIIEHGVHGLLVPPCDPEALALAILRILQEPELALRLAQAGHARMRNNFSFDRLITQIELLYQQPRGGQSRTPLYATVKPRQSESCTNSPCC